MVLPATAGDLERAEQRSQPSGSLPVPALLDAMQQPGAIGVAAAGRVEQCGRLGAGNDDLLAARVDGRSFAAARDDEGARQLGELLDLFAGLVLQQLRLVIVHRHVIGLFDEAQQLVSRKHRHALSRIEYPRNGRLVEFARVLQHAFAPVRRNDAQSDVAGLTDMVVFGKTHRTGVERGDLVVVQVGGDERLPGIAAGDMADVRLRQTEFFQAQRIGGKVVADRRHNQRMAAEQFQVIGDVARTAAKLAAHLRHHERHIQDMDLFRQNVLLELIRKHHDGVVGHGTANQCVHRKTSLLLFVNYQRGRRPFYTASLQQHAGVLDYNPAHPSHRNTSCNNLPSPAPMIGTCICATAR